MVVGHRYFWLSELLVHLEETMNLRGWQKKTFKEITATIANPRINFFQLAAQCNWTHFFFHLRKVQKRAIYSTVKYKKINYSFFVNNNK
jgi:hypothetical protein